MSKPSMLVFLKVWNLCERFELWRGIAKLRSGKNPTRLTRVYIFITFWHNLCVCVCGFDYMMEHKPHLGSFFSADPHLSVHDSPTPQMPCLLTTMWPNRHSRRDHCLWFSLKRRQTWHKDILTLAQLKMQFFLFFFLTYFILMTTFLSTPDSA